MTTLRHMLAVTLALAASAGTATAQEAAPAAAVQPAPYQTRGVYFGRSGKVAAVELAAIQGGTTERAVLRAFGRTWTEPVTSRLRDGIPVAEFTVPAVRVPTVFDVTPPEWAGGIMATLVAYPDRDVVWNQETKKPGQDKPAKKITLYAAGAPQWFSEWAAAVGLPVKSVAVAELLPTPVDPDGELPPVLLIVGRAAAGQGLEGMQKLAAEKKVNVLVLDATWFGPAAGKVAVEPRQMRAGLAEMASQRWPQPLEFAAHGSPHGGLVNRWAWITDGEGLPLVETATKVSDSPSADSVRPVVLSYLPWPSQVGRSESADAALLALLASAARSPAVTLEGHPVRFIYPAKEKIDPKERPILAAVQSAEPVARDGSKPDYKVPFIHILDLRGKQPPAAEGKELSERCRQAVGGQAAARLVILGDDPLLDGWKWLKLDRVKKVAHAAEPTGGGVVWLSDDELPPSAAQQIRLMMTFTELGIPLVCITKKETSDER